MFERFTQAARDAVVRAQTEARGLDHDRIGTEHLLLALLHSGLTVPGLTYPHVHEQARRRTPATLGVEPDRDQADAAALKAIGIDLDQVRRTIEATFGPDALSLPPPEQKRSWWRRAMNHVPFTPRARKVLELSLREALRLKQRFIAPEHLMLGILRDNGGTATQIMTDAGVDLTALGQQLETALLRQAV
ncbi:Clp protease [Pilimelia terevasa]|uniref:Clp protease n=1 Tax=Pilimelia terevasa TaxID=53372 RepID=A0A8J3BQM2_9ACTN|nr:Clp protease N-terminal domain-containing protein [Pilimelia terevasa]GGK31590.1 Clp protease [Pilimelia terevasa]